MSDAGKLPDVTEQDHGAQCETCGGDGWIVEAVCCGKVSGLFGCCGSPEPCQAQCPSTLGTGKA